MYLIVFDVQTPDEFVFPKHEQLESYCRERGWQSLFASPEVRAGCIRAAEPPDQLLGYFRPRLAPAERATVFLLHTEPESGLVFQYREQLWQWALEHSLSHSST